MGIFNRSSACRLTVATLAAFSLIAGEASGQCPTYTHQAFNWDPGASVTVTFDSTGTAGNGLGNPSPRFALTSNSGDTHFMNGIDTLDNIAGTGVTFSSGSGGQWLVTTAWPKANHSFSYNGQSYSMTCQVGPADLDAVAVTCPKTAVVNGSLRMVGAVTVLNTNGTYYHGGQNHYIYGPGGANWSTAMQNLGAHEGVHGFGVADYNGSSLSLMRPWNGQNDYHGSSSNQLPADNCLKKAIQNNPNQYAQYDRLCTGSLAVPAPPLGGSCSCNTSSGKWECACSALSRPSCNTGYFATCTGGTWSCVAPDTGGGSEDPLSGACYDQDGCYGDGLVGWSGGSASGCYTDYDCDGDGYWYFEDCNDRDGAFSSCGVSTDWVVTSYSGGGGGSGGPMTSARMDGAGQRVSCSNQNSWPAVTRISIDSCVNYCAYWNAAACEWDVTTGDCIGIEGDSCSLSGNDPGWYGFLNPNPPSTAGWLQSGEYLLPDESILSEDGRFELIYQNDGNLVLYDQYGSPLWASGTSGSPGFVSMQGDGNLVVYDSGSSPQWSSSTGGWSGAELLIQNDGNMVLYYGSTPIWATNTCCH